MIPAAFDYYRPKDMAGVLSILEEHGDDARVMAGGHSLIPMMKLRMADVPHLIDLQDVSGMSDIVIGADSIRIGAMVTQHHIIENADIAKAAPILREAALQIADPQVRYMGTIGGNVANGDPGNDMPGLMQCLDATFTVVGPDGERDIDARAFYEAAYMTAREDDEVLIVSDGGTCVSAAIAMTNLSDTPIFSEAAGAALVGTTVDETAVKAAMAAMLGDIDPSEDNRGPVAFKKHVAGVILRRAIERAWSRA